MWFMTYCSKKRNTPWVCVHIRGHCILNKLVLLKSQFFGWVKGIKVKKEIKKKLIFLPTLAVCSPQLLLFIIANLSDFFFSSAFDQLPCMFNWFLVLTVSSVHGVSGIYLVPSTSPYHWWPLCTHSPTSPTSPPCRPRSCCHPMPWL